MENYDLSSTFRIAELILHKQENKLPMEEAEELEAWLQASERNEALLAECNDENNLQELINTYFSATDTDIAFETKIAPHLRGEEGIQKREGIVRGMGAKRGTGRFYWMTGIAAASLIATVATMLWYPHSNERGALPTASNPIVLKKVTAPGAEAAIIPGRQRAELTLSNGKIIPLDNVPDGLVSVEGSTRIVKTNKGLVSYGAAGTALATNPGSASP